MERTVFAALLLFSASPLAAHAEPTTTVAPPTTATVVAPNPQLDRALLDQLHKKQWEAALQTLATGASANARDKDGTTALMLAAQEGQPELVRVLLERGANPNATNKAGFTALHLATQIGAPTPKKKSGFGGLVKSLGGTVVGGAFGNASTIASSLLGGRAIDGMLGANLQGLLGGASFNLAGQNNWTAVLGTALQGDIKNNGAFGVQNLLSSRDSGLNANGWIGLVRSVQSANPAVLAAMTRPEGSDAAQNTLWAQFLGAASSGDEATVAALLDDGRLAPLLTQATQGLRSASAQLPANAAYSIVSQLLQSGANPQAADEKGRTATQLAQERGWDAVAALLQDKSAPQTSASAQSPVR